MEFEHNQLKKTFYFEAQDVRYVKFVAEKASQMGLTDSNGNPMGFVAVAEFDIDYVDPATCDHARTEIRNAKDATCTEGGYTGDTYCVICSTMIAEGEATEATGHVNTETRDAKDATCTEDGYTGDTYCKICNVKIAEGEVIDALGHKEVTVDGKPATCTEAGMTAGKKCSVCNVVLEGCEEILPLGHDFVNGDCSRCDAVLDAPFEDVPVGAFYFDPVKWAVEKGVTTGATDTTFNPNGQCQRAAVVTFLWRAAGSPEPTKSENPFTDVPEDAFYYKAVLWAVEKGITNGLTETTFGPFALCNRAQVVTFLWRAMEKPAPESAEHPFTDIDEKQFYYEAMLWAVEKGITNGLTETTFGPNAICNRAQVVTFLYRTLVNQAE